MEQKPEATQASGVPESEVARELRDLVNLGYLDVDPLSDPTDPRFNLTVRGRRYLEDE